MSDFEERLRLALGSIELTELESRYVSWLAGMDRETVEVFAGLFEKCRSDRPVGRWVNERMLVGGFAEVWGSDCSECGKTVADSKPKWCPGCGAYMENHTVEKVSVHYMSKDRSINILPLTTTKQNSDM